MAEESKESAGLSNNQMAAAETGMLLFDIFNAGKRKKNAEKWQRYRDEVRRIGSAINDGAITRQAVCGEEDLRASRLSASLESITSAGTSTVQAAIMGFSGNTADAVSDAYQRSADLQQRSIDRQQDRLQKSENYQRLQNSWGTYTSMESIHSPVPEPDFGAMGARAGMRIAKAITGGA